MLVGHYEDADPTLQAVNWPSIDLRQQTLVLSRPEGSVGIHLHQGRWIKTEKPFECERPFKLEAGQDELIETYVALGKSYDEVMPVIYELYRRDSLAWLNDTVAFWRERIGQLEVSAEKTGDAAEMSRDVYVRCLLDNFNCLQTDGEGNLVSHWQGAPSHGYGTIWGIDVEPTAVSIVHLVPEMTLQTLLFFMTRSRAPRGSVDHSIPILIAPVILARQWLQVTGHIAYLRAHPEIMEALQSILDELMQMKAPSETLFPSRFSSDGPVGRRYDYGTNAKVYYAFVSMAYLLRQLGQNEQAAFFNRMALEIKEATSRTMVVKGPFGPQISGGTNLGEDPENFYSPEDMLYYDGEDTSSMLAPIYGFCDFTDPAWVNYHRFARSMWCYNYDAEFDTLLWSPAEPGVVDGTALFSRLGGSLTKKEMTEAFETLRKVGIDEVTGSVFWWPHGRLYKRELTRCSQGQGAWAWQYLYQWLGLRVDANDRRLILAPCGMLSKVTWKGFKAGSYAFDVEWAEDGSTAIATVKNQNAESWTVQVGFHPPDSGAESGLDWQTTTLGPGEETTFSSTLSQVAVGSVDQAMVVRMEARQFGRDGVLFKRFGPALLWGHWDLTKLWNMRELPFSLRFALGNATGVDWTGTTIDLYIPQGWKAQGRGPLEWPYPDQLEPEKVTLQLGLVPDGSRTAACFWIQGPEGYNFSRAWNDIRPFHVPSQPGDEVNLWIESAASETTEVFKVVLCAKAGDGSEILREVAVPVKIHPAR